MKQIIDEDIMKTAESYLTRGEGNYRNCTDYDDAVKAIKFAQIEAVAKRDEEIREYFNDVILEDSNYFNEDALHVFDDVLIFLSTPTVKPNAEIAQVEPEKVSDNFRINIIPELSRGELEERCIEMYDRFREEIRAEAERLYEKWAVLIDNHIYMTKNLFILALQDSKWYREQMDREQDDWVGKLNGICVLIKIEADKLPANQFDYRQMGKMEAYSHCYIELLNLIEKISKPLPTVPLK